MGYPSRYNAQGRHCNRKSGLYNRRVVGEYVFRMSILQHFEENYVKLAAKLNPREIKYTIHLRRGGGHLEFSFSHFPCAVLDYALAFGPNPQIMYHNVP